VEYYRGKKSLPIYEHHAKGCSGEDVATILCDPTLDGGKKLKRYKKRWILVSRVF